MYASQVKHAALAKCQAVCLQTNSLWLVDFRLHARKARENRVNKKICAWSYTLLEKYIMDLIGPKKAENEPMPQLGTKSNIIAINVGKRGKNQKPLSRKSQHI